MYKLRLGSVHWNGSVLHLRSCWQLLMLTMWLFCCMPASPLELPWADKNCSFCVQWKECMPFDCQIYDHGWFSDSGVMVVFSVLGRWLDFVFMQIFLWTHASKRLEDEAHLGEVSGPSRGRFSRVYITSASEWDSDYCSLKFCFQVLSTKAAIKVFSWIFGYRLLCVFVCR